MTNNDDLALNLKAKASLALDAWNKFVSLPDDVDLERGLSLYEMSLLSAHYAVSNPANILALLAERNADKAENASLRQRVAEMEKKEVFLKEQLCQLANFNPDWDMLEAARDSLREHVAALTAAQKRIAELEVRTVSVNLPDEFYSVAENIRTQDNRITSDPMFCVYQKREIAVDSDCDYDRIVWVDEDGNEASEHKSARLELLHENFREPRENWRRVAVKDIDDFVTCCFTEKGCKDYLACNGHNLRLPFIYVKSGFRNAEYISIRNWLAGIKLEVEE